MDKLLFHSRFSRNIIIPILGIAMGLFLLIFGIPIGILVGIATILEIISFSIKKIFDIFLLCMFTFVFLVIVPFTAIILSYHIPQQQIKIFNNYVEISHSSSVLFWRKNWQKYNLRDYPYFISDFHNLSLVNKDLQYIEFTIHSKSRHNKQQINEARKVLKKLGLKMVSIEEWANMRIKKYSKESNKRGTPNNKVER